jgi:hypothetical protein
MKTTNVKTAKNKLREILRDAQVEHVAIMNHGRPARSFAKGGELDPHRPLLDSPAVFLPTTFPTLPA